VWAKYFQHGNLVVKLETKRLENQINQNRKAYCRTPIMLHKLTSYLA
jgi:hypothetical protein